MAAPAPANPPPSPWAFGQTYAHPLPAHLALDPQTDFVQLTTWAAALVPAVPAGSQTQLTPASKVATYPSHAAKQSEVSTASSQTSQDAAKAGHVLSAAKSAWPARTAVVGVVVSSQSSAVEHQAGLNNWHTVAMARDGDTVWVHDPEYRAADYTSSTRKRVENVSGNRMVKALINEWPRVQGVWFQGPPSTFTQGQQQCMGRSALWVEHTLAGTAPWPPNTPGSGGTWTFHHKN